MASVQINNAIEELVDERLEYGMLDGPACWGRVLVDELLLEALEQ